MQNFQFKLTIQFKIEKKSKYLTNIPLLNIYKMFKFQKI